MLSMGHKRAEAMLREILALPVDRAVLLFDPDLAGSDTLATAKALASAAETVPLLAVKLETMVKPSKS